MLIILPIRKYNVMNDYSRLHDSLGRSTYRLINRVRKDKNNNMVKFGQLMFSDRCGLFMLLLNVREVRNSEVAFNISWYETKLEFIPAKILIVCLATLCSYFEQNKLLIYCVCSIFLLHTKLSICLQWKWLGRLFRN